MYLHPHHEQDTKWILTHRVARRAVLELVLRLGAGHVLQRVGDVIILRGKKQQKRTQHFYRRELCWHFYDTKACTSHQLARSKERWFPSSQWSAAFSHTCKNMSTNSFRRSKAKLQDIRKVTCVSVKSFTHQSSEAQTHEQRVSQHASASAQRHWWCFKGEEEER